VRGLETVINQSNAQYRGTIGKINEAISTETGGDTFCYLAFDDWITWENGKPQPQKAFSLDLERVGKYPLRDLSLIVDDHVKNSLMMNQFIKQGIQNHTAPSNEKIFAEMDQARNASEITIQIGDFGMEHKWLGVYPANGQDREEFDVLFRAFNSNGWIERASLSRINGKWKRAVLVELYDQRRDKWTKIDKDYPRKDGHLDVNWPRPVKGRAKRDH
jgi:hypothetical protein